ncbi:MAG TPA: lytic transglycosylase domain-containing protein [Candidatus Eisenbacteria bacterium]|nr:lytic transglycosylase domain-containing protein [Candidatus Eisenbacteria bacterium]
MTRGRAPFLAAWLGAVWLLSALAFAPGMFLAGAEAAWREGTADLAARRKEWDEARRAYRDARWTRPIPDILAAFDREARAESTYLATLEAWVAAGATAVADRPGPETEHLLRSATLDLADRGKWDPALRLLQGPLRYDRTMVPTRARIVGLKVSPDSGLALLGWPPDRRPGAKSPGAPAFAWDPASIARTPETDAALLVAAELADSANDGRAQRAALWKLLDHPRPALRRHARLQLARALIAGREPELANALLARAEAMTDDEKVLLATLRADLLAAAGDTLAGLRQLIDFTRDAEISTSLRYGLVRKASGWTEGARVDSLDETRWLDLVRMLGNVGEAEAALRLLERRRIPPGTAPAELSRAEREAEILARLRRHPQAAQRYQALLRREDRPREDRARYALGLARSLRAMSEFTRMDSAFVAAVALDPTGETAPVAAWERAREWEDEKPPREAAAIFQWAQRYGGSMERLEDLNAHQVIAWLRAGEPDSANQAVMDLLEDTRGYWRAKAQFARGDSAAAYRHLEQVAKEWTYEAVRAQEELKRVGLRLHADRADSLRSPARRDVPAPQSDPDAPLDTRLLAAAGHVPLQMEALRACARDTTALPAARECTDDLEDRGVFRVGRPAAVPAARLDYPPAYAHDVFDAARREALDPFLLWAIMRQESAYQRLARSRAGAIGLLQLLPSTASALQGSTVGEDALTDPALNVRLGARYLRALLREFKDPRAAMAAYNAGEEPVRRWLQERPVVDDLWVELIPYRETREYVKQVYTIWRRYEALYGAGAGVGEP